MVKYVLTTTLLVLAVVATGCASGPGPEEVLTKSRDAMGELRSYRAVMNMVVNSEEGVHEARIFHEWVSPDRWHMRFESLDEASGESNEVVVIAGRLFTRESDPDQGAWREQTTGLHLGSLSRSAGDYVPPDLEGLQLMEDDVVNGVPAFQVTGRQVLVRDFPADSLESPEPVPKEFVTDYTFLIDEKNFRVVRIITEQDLGPTSQQATIDFHDYNQPITIEMPELNGE